MERRVVVTGVGLVSPLGVGTKPTWEGLVRGQAGIGPITRFDAREFDARIAGEVKGFEPRDFIEPKEVKKMDLFIAYSLAAAQFALESAHYSIGPGEAERIGVLVGSGIGGFGIIEREHEKLLKSGPSRISPFFIPAVIVNLASGHISIRFGAKGPNSATCTACSTGAHAIGDSYKLIQRGAAEVMIAGGTESAITPLSVGGFAAMRALSTRNDDAAKASRPFDRDRDGFVIGEGAGVLILEELKHAIRRDAPILAEIVGYGMSGDAFHMTAPPPDGSGAIRVMQAALDDAGVPSQIVGYINAHGTSTPLNDKVESLAIKKVFGEHAYQLAISSTKSMTGHLLGAAGGLEAGICVLALQDQMLPPTINYDNPDPDCDLDYVPNKAREVAFEYALSNSFGFGGTNAALLFKRFES
ncbi:MAG TPA: beta-ketoacyl-ACP synthase II [Acidobacteriota bacterium]